MSLKKRVINICHTLPCFTLPNPYYTSDCIYLGTTCHGGGGSPGGGGVTNGPNPDEENPCWINTNTSTTSSIEPTLLQQWSNTCNSIPGWPGQIIEVHGELKTIIETTVCLESICEELEDGDVIHTSCLHEAGTYGIDDSNGCATFTFYTPSYEVNNSNVKVNHRYSTYFDSVSRMFTILGNNINVTSTNTHNETRYYENKCD